MNALPRWGSNLGEGGGSLMRWPLGRDQVPIQSYNNNKKAHYANDTLLHIIATHSLAHNTLPALQKTGAHSPSTPTAFSPRIHNVKVDKFRLLSLEMVTYRRMGIHFAARILLFLVIELGLLWWELTATTPLLQRFV